MCTLRNATLACGLAVAVLGVGATEMHAQDIEQATARYELGQRLGECLVRGCVVLVGVVEALGNPEMEQGETDEKRAVMTRTVDIRVSEWLYGRPGGEHIQLVHATPPQFSKTNIGPWTPWEGVAISVGGRLLVARWAANAPRATWRGKPDDVALAVSDPNLFAPVRQAVDQHGQFERQPDEVAKIPQLLRGQPDAVFTGYALTYLMEGEGVRNVDNAAVILSGLLRSPALPGPARTAVPDWLASNFYRLSGPARNATTESLAVAASADDAGVANPALSVLVRLGDLKLLNLKPVLTPARQGKIVENYRAFRAKNRIQQEHPEFELQLGVR